MLWWLHTCKTTKRTKKKGTKIVFLISKPNQNNAVTDVREEELNGIESAKDKAKDTFRHWLPVWSPLYRRKCHQQRMSPSKTERERSYCSWYIHTATTTAALLLALFFIIIFFKFLMSFSAVERSRLKSGLTLPEWRFHADNIQVGSVDILSWNG